MRLRLVLLVASLAAAAAPVPVHAKSQVVVRNPVGHVRVVRLATVAIPGDPKLVRIAREVLDVAVAIDPGLAATSGLLADATRTPALSAAAVKKHVARLERALAALAKLPWRTWTVDRQIDFRWLYAQAELLRHQLVVERLHTHRPASWLEPLANTLIAYASDAPADRVGPRKLWAQVPAMLREIRAVAHPQLTRRDRETTLRLVPALIEMATKDGSPAGKAAAKALEAYRVEVDALRPEREHQVIGAEAFAWRLNRALLIEGTPAELLADAHATLAKIDAEAAALKAKLPATAGPTSAEQAAATALTREQFLALYDGITADLRAATIAGDFVTVPDAVGPLRARETPEAMVPFTGDGGSMNPPPPFGGEVGYWNVERFRTDWTAAVRLEMVQALGNWRGVSMGPYAAHEAYPGHHLQLSIARLNPNPLRTILQDGAMAEGWGLYAEEELWRHGGLGDRPAARAAVLRSFRFRAARVVYSVNIEGGTWTLQQGADFKDRVAAGKGEIDEEVLRSIQWPTQLITYFAGKRAIERLKAEVKAKQGVGYSDRRFNDALLAEGTIPIALIRAKLLGTPVPGL